MNKYPVTNGINDEELALLAECLHLEKRSFRRGEVIMKLSEAAGYSCIMHSGTACLRSIDEQGEENILDIYLEGDIFGSLISTESDVNLYYVFAKTDCDVSFFATEGITGLCKRLCPCHRRFAQNVLGSAVRRSRIHLDILSGRTIRKKLVSVFEYFAQEDENGLLYLPVPLSDLAEYICVDRSAMMRELAKMKRENLISSPAPDRYILNSGLISEG